MKDRIEKTMTFLEEGTEKMIEELKNEETEDLKLMMRLATERFDTLPVWKACREILKERGVLE